LAAPLADQLFLDTGNAFGAIVRRYSKLAHILPYLREPSNHTSVEEVLKSLGEEATDFVVSKSELMSGYLYDLFSEVLKEWHAQSDGVTNYAPLIREILGFNKSTEPVCLVTFNYDLLLDATPSVMRRPLLKTAAATQSPGSLNSMTPSTGDRRPTKRHQTWSPADNRNSKRIRFRRRSNPINIPTFERPVLPAIAIPMPNKTRGTFE
jgi:hypothetical protein